MTKEFDFEPVRGLPEALPAGEVILWQGAPSAWGLATQVFHLRAAAGYVVGASALLAAGSAANGASLAQALGVVAAALPLAALAAGLLYVVAWINARSSVYTITNRRVVLRIGAALTKAINIPFRLIGAAHVAEDPTGRGTLALTLSHKARVPLLYLWPHARPGFWRAPQPAFRAVDQVAAPAKILADALAAYALANAVEGEQPAPETAAAPERSPDRAPERPAGVISPQPQGAFA